MGADSDYKSRSIFHFRYFHLVAQVKQFRYTKHRPQHVVDRAFLNELIQRRRDTNHLPTFGAGGKFGLTICSCPLIVGERFDAATTSDPVS